MGLYYEIGYEEHIGNKRIHKKSFLESLKETDYYEDLDI
jgi:hypothetical protein